MQLSRESDGMSNFYDQFDETADAPVAPEHLQACRSRKTAMEKRNLMIFWAHIAMAGLLFVISLYTSAIVSSDPTLEGPQKFYVGFTVAFAQILLALATIALGAWAYMMKRLPTYALMGLFIVHIFYTIMASYDYLNYVYILYDAIGLVLNYMRLSLIAEHEWLQKQPGYPYFTEALVRSNEYELPKHITHRRPPSDDMDSVGDVIVPKTAAPEAPAVPVDITLEDMTAPEIRVPEVKLPPPVVLHGDAGLEAFSAPAAAEEPKTEPAKEQILVPSADAVLADMTVPQERGAVGPLPDPEDVKERLRQMAARKRSEGSGS